MADWRLNLPQQQYRRREESGIEQLGSLIASISELSQKGRDIRNEGTVESLNNILKLSKYATNEDSLANVTRQWMGQKSNASENNETNVYYNLIGNVLKDRGAQITQYSNIVDQAAEVVNSADFLRQKGDFEKLPEWVMSQENEDGTKKYDSVMQWVSDEYAKIETYSNALESGSKLGFRRGKGIDDVNITTQINQYKQRLDNTLEALIGDEAITPMEAQLIIAGDRQSFQNHRDRRVNNITKGIEQYDTIIQNFDDETVLKGLLEDLNLDIDIGDSSSEREAVLKNFIFERDKQVDNYKRWTGFDYSSAYKTSSQLEEEEFKRISDSTFNDTDSDDDGVPDNIDPDTLGVERTVSEKPEGYVEPKKDKLEVKLDAIKSEEVRPQQQEFKDRQIKALDNQIKEKKTIIDGSDKASAAMKRYLNEELNQNQALSEGAHGGKESRKEVVGRKNRVKLREFQLKFKNSGLTMDAFILQNKEEYYEMTKLLKYGRYWKKEPATFPSKHYINLYD